MDWTAILVAAIPAVCGIISAYMAHGAKKKTEAGNEVIVARIDCLEKKNLANTEILEMLKDNLDMQESANLIQQNQLSKIAQELNDNNLRTLRLDLLHAIETDPNNQLVIIDLAKKYFVDFKGNCYMSRVFQEWADGHNVNITSIFNKG